MSPCKRRLGSRFALTASPKNFGSLLYMGPNVNVSMMVSVDVMFLPYVNQSVLGKMRTSPLEQVRVFFLHG